MKSPPFLDPVSEELRRMEERMLEVAQADHPRLAEVLSYPFRHPGKRLRPAVVLLSARASGGQFDLDKVLSLAAAVEMLHTATLVHDDLIDAAPLRRGSPTVSSLWGDQIALFAGDYLFAGAASLAAETGDAQVITLFAHTLVSICTGEMQQSLRAPHWQQLEEDYYQRIRGKTASLFVLSAQGGALLSAAPDGTISALRNYGHNLGMAFQIVDDILDFVGDEEELGKPRGSDLHQGTITLPTIYFLEGHPQNALLQWVLEGRGSGGGIQSAVERIGCSTAIKRSRATARGFAAKAKKALDALPRSRYHQALLDLADYVTERRK